MLQAQAPSRRTVVVTVCSYALSIGLLVWSFAPVLLQMSRKWNTDPKYSHGWLVGLIAVAILWKRRDILKDVELKHSLWGVALVFAGFALRWAGHRYFMIWVESISMLVCLTGILVAVSGWNVLRWAWPGLLFMTFMVPLPFRVEQMVSPPLQHGATEVSTYMLQTVGIPALSEGNTILLSDMELGIVEACSGLRMIMILVAITTALIFFAELTRGQQVVIALSAVPIAILANALRIIAMGVIQENYNHKAVETVVHDVSGWLMMPVALAVVWAEIEVTRRMFPTPAAEEY